MKPIRPVRVWFFHALKTWAVMMLSFVPLVLLADYLPSWAFNVLFLAVALLIFFPVVFAIGPIGRRIGRPLNEMAVAQAKQKREALGTKPSSCCAAEPESNRNRSNSTDSRMS